MTPDRPDHGEPREILPADPSRKAVIITNPKGMNPDKIDALGRLLFGSRYTSDLAAALGLTRHAVIHWVKGSWRPREANVEAMRELARQRIADLRAALK